MVLTVGTYFPLVRARRTEPIEKKGKKRTRNPAIFVGWFKIVPVALSDLSSNPLHEYAQVVVLVLEQAS